MKDRDDKYSLGSYLFGQIGYGVYLCSKIYISNGKPEIVWKSPQNDDVAIVFPAELAALNWERIWEEERCVDPLGCSSASLDSQWIVW